MAPTEPTQPEVPGPSGSGATNALRMLVFVVAGLALCVVVWALIEGGERDLWTRSATAVVPWPSMELAW